MRPAANNNAGMTNAQVLCLIALFAIAPAWTIVSFIAGAWVAWRCTKGLSPAPQIQRKPAKAAEPKTNDKPQPFPRVQI